MRDPFLSFKHAVHGLYDRLTCAFHLVPFAEHCVGYDILLFDNKNTPDLGISVLDIKRIILIYERR